MRRLIASGLYLICGLMAGRAEAEEIQWRAAAPHAAAASMTQAQSPSSSVTLFRPVPLVSRVADPDAGKITAVSYQTATLETPNPIVRFQRADAAQPMPMGPALNGEETLGPPRPLITGNGGGPAPMSPDVVSRWIGETPDFVPGGIVPRHGDSFVGHGGMCDCGNNCGDACGPVCCDPCGPVCCDPCCEPCCECCPNCCADRGRFWFSGEYLLWAFRRDALPPLVTTNTNGLPASLSNPGTVVLFGGNGTDDKDFSGGRFTIGYWCCHCPELGIEGSYFFLGQLNKTFAIGSNGMMSLGRPLNVVNPTLDAMGNIVPPGENVEIVSLGQTSGNVVVSQSSRLWGAELNGRYQWCCGPCWHVDFLTGFRYVDLQESINISENLTTPGGVPGVPTGGTSNIIVSDRFGTHDQFYGGQIGLDTEGRWGRWFLAGTFKLAMGDMVERLNIGGNTTFTLPGAAPVTQNGGVLALASNIGTFSRNRFAVIPEVGLKFGVNITPHWRIFAGYNFMYLSDVVRPGDQIDRRVNTNQFPSVFQGTTLAQPALPAPLFKTTDFWAQGLTAGMEFRY
jgi:Putative beta barrel porin-7 (BBP7)